ncbi:Bax inhibitor-1/YccA family protein [Acidiphilium sp. C61]|uniref:Bax inhibitor-1/YccA family protein n=1 Tax=Acidiphilium sp. C61 TaxID=1671485 RepID=UPI00157AB18E|nr:Bax inhibitor-1/YccA family protein [Acidiphilium sp. C61]
MAMGPDMRSYRSASVAAGTGVLDEGLRAYMLRVYNWMASGLLLTAIVSYAIANTGLINAFYPLVAAPGGAMIRQPGILAYISIFAPLGFMLVMSFGVNKLSTTQAQALFWAFCAVMGASLTNIFLVYTGQSILTTFFVTAVTFGSMSLYGYTTRNDLTKFGSFLVMGVIGLLVAMIVNIFLHSPVVQFAISAIGVLIFTGLAAYDTQRIKADYLQYGSRFGDDVAAKRSVYDALQLYLNFINLFLFLLQFMGNRKN